MLYESLIRALFQVFINIIVYVILLNLVSSSFYDVMAYYKGYLLVFIIFPLLTLVSSIILSSIVLGMLNTTMLFYIYNPNLFFNKTIIIELIGIYMFSLIVSFIIFRLLGFQDKIIILTKEASIEKTSLPTNIIFHNYALFFALLSLILPLVIYGYYYLQQFFSIENKVFYYFIMFYLPINILISLVTLAYSKTQLSSITTALLTSFSTLAFTPLVMYSLEEIISARKIKTLDNIKPINESKGIVFGVIEACLNYGVPRNVYNGIKQEWVKDKKRKTWYWRNYRDLLIIDPYKLPNRHTVIIGSSGMGKSLLAKHLLLEYHTKFKTNFIVFDPHNEYYILKKYIDSLEIYDASTLTLNPLELGRLGPRERAHQISSVIMSLFRLGHLQRQAIEEVIIKTYENKGIYPDSPSTWNIKPPTMNDVLETCSYLMEENDLYKRVLPYIRILADNVFSSSTISLNKIFSKPSIITLNNLKSDYVRLLYVDTFLQRLLDMMYKREIKDEHIIVLDEAYTLLARDYTRNIVSRLLMESRKYGLGIIFITQYPLSIPSSIIENASIKISFNISEPRNLSYVSKIYSDIYVRDKINSIRHVLRTLKSLKYIIAINGINEIFIVDESGLLRIF